MFGIQIAQFGKIVDYGEVCSLYFVAHLEGKYFMERNRRWPKRGMGPLSPEVQEGIQQTQIKI